MQSAIVLPEILFNEKMLRIITHTLNQLVQFNTEEPLEIVAYNNNNNQKAFKRVQNSVTV